MLTDEQISARASGLGGSDVAAICGESNYRGPMDVYLEKRHGLGLPIPVAPPEGFKGNSRTEFGHILEPAVADRYAHETGLRLVEPTTTYRHPDRPWHLGTPDRFAYKPDEEQEDSFSVLDAVTGEELSIPVPLKILEVKTHGMMGGKAYDVKTQQIPSAYVVQVAWYRALTGVKDSVLAALIDTHLFHIFHLPHDQAVEDYLLEEAESFWKKVEDGVEPSPDGTEMFNDYLKGRFQRDEGDMVDASAETMVHIAEYHAAKANKKAADARMELAKQEIQMAVGHHQGLLVPGSNKPAVTWKRRQNGLVSYAKLVSGLREKYEISDSEFEAIKQDFTGTPPRDFRVK